MLNSLGTGVSTESDLRIQRPRSINLPSTMMSTVNELRQVSLLLYFEYIFKFLFTLNYVVNNESTHSRQAIASFCFDA